jgi:serine/threonine-protein kinase
MTDIPRVRQLLDQLLASQTTPEEVCESCPKLLPMVRHRWRQICHLRADLDALFPPPTEPTQQPLAGAALPQIPGYEIEALLGRGGMGIVFRARHLRLGRPVALKMLLAGTHASPEERKRFLREAKAVAGLRHANIVQVHDMGEHDGRPYFTMEYVEGGSLADRLMGTPLGARYAAALVATLAEAVQAAHHGGIIHRDLKPANILLQRKAEIPSPSPQSENAIPLGLAPAALSEFDPKIADFGLARPFEGGSSLTQSGARVGTPSYMAPEQALGKTRALGPSVDIYALGAVLYELLTGRPPFQGETPTDTLLQVVQHDLVPPSRLNPRVPRDLETICLKCLEKSPASRYGSAQDLADDLRRFLDGKPVLARPVGTLGRAGRWIKRHPRETALAGLALLLVLGGGAWAWWSDRQAVVRRAERRQQQERTRRGAEGALEQARSLRVQARWPQARKALEQAELLLGSDGPEDLRRRVTLARRDLRTAAELDRIRQLKETIAEKSGYEAPVHPAYVRAFRDHGLAILDGDLGDLGQRIRDSEIKPQLIVALDHWAFLEPDEALQERLTALARAVDPDAWRDRVRNPAVWKDRAALVELAVTAPLTEQPAQLLIALGSRLPVAGVHTMSPPAFAASLAAAPTSPAGISNLLTVAALAPGATDGVEFLRRVQQEHPDDFWANFTLGNALMSHGAGEAIVYFQAALAIRPQAVAVHNNLGLALRSMRRPRLAIDLLRRALRIAPRDSTLHNNLGIALIHIARPAEAIKHFRQALAELPSSATIHNNLGIGLKARGQIDEAIEEYRKAIRIDSKDPRFHTNLALAQLSKGRLDEAIKHYREGSRLLPLWCQARVDLGAALQRQGRFEEAIDQYRLAVRLDAWEPKAHYNLGNALMLRGRPEEALGSLKRALVLDPNLAAAHYSLGRISAANGQLDEAVNSHRQAVQLDPGFAFAHFELAHTLKDLHRFDQAIHHYQETFRLDPTHANSQGALAQVLVTVGRFREARAAALRCLELLPEGDARRPPTQRLIESAERLLALEARLPAILQGKQKPANSGECYQFGNICRMKKRPVAAARFYAEALEAAPEMVADPRTARRYLAACAAAFVGCGGDEGGEKPSEDERTRWRKQARAWLRADLAAWTRMLDRDPGAIRTLCKRALTRWQVNPDLAGLRDPQALALVPPGEREECRALWNEVRALWRRAQSAEPE